MHSCTVLAYTFDGAVYCPACWDDDDEQNPEVGVIFADTEFTSIPCCGACNETIDDVNVITFAFDKLEVDHWIDDHGEDGWINEHDAAEHIAHGLPCYAVRLPMLSLDLVVCLDLDGKGRQVDHYDAYRAVRQWWNENHDHQDDNCGLARGKFCDSCEFLDDGREYIRIDSNDSPVSF